MKKLKYLLKWRSRAVYWGEEWKKQRLKIFHLEKTISVMQKRFDESIRHNIYLARHNDSLNDRISYLLDEESNDQ